MTFQASENALEQRDSGSNKKGRMNHETKF
jgi:hypothetical protein